eukprot:jgi/Astpho2/4080/Aster-x1198
MLWQASVSDMADRTFFPTEGPRQLPRGYEDTSRKLIGALQDALQADMDGAPEKEVRRRANPAQGFVKDWVGKWRDDVAVRGSDSHREITGKHAKRPLRLRSP